MHPRIARHRAHRRLKAASVGLQRALVIAWPIIFVLWAEQGRWPSLYPPLLVLASVWAFAFPVALVLLIAEVATKPRRPARGECDAGRTAERVRWHA